jgi:GT2 family glycosyltransferase
VSIDLVVVNYKTPGDLGEFIDSLIAYPPWVDAGLTVINVDTHSYVDRLPWAGRCGRVVGVAGNIGYGRACNLGARYGGRDQIAFFNADVVITPKSLDLCYAALAGNENWGILGPRQVDEAHRIRHAGIFGSLTQPLHRGWGETDHGQYCDVLDAVTVSGSAYFVKRSVFEELSKCPIYRQSAPDAQGALLPTPHYYEETYLSYHAQAHGHKVAYYGWATMIHKWHRASPLGGWADQQMPISQKLFRAACDAHNIPHD